MSDKPEESAPVVTSNLSDRDRFKLESKSPLVNQQELRKKILTPTKPTNNDTKDDLQKSPTKDESVVPSVSIKEDSSDDEVIVVPKGYKDYVCEKCTKCLEFESKSKKDTTCTNCGCELLYHLVNHFTCDQ